MRPFELGGGPVYRKKVYRKKVAKALKPASRRAPAAPRTYVQPPKPDKSTQRILAAEHGYSKVRDLGPTPGKKQEKAIRRDAYARAQFPYTNRLQVAYANAKGDVERNILPRATKVPTKPPKVQAGRPELARRVAGYAYRGRNVIFLTPSGYMTDPKITRDVALHEFAHTRQSKAGAPKYLIEGGADYAAKQLAKKLGLPPYRPGYPKYLKSVERRVRAKRKSGR